MKRTYIKTLLRGALLLTGILFMAGCSDILKSPSDFQDAQGDSLVTITIASGGERTVAPQISQFSKIVLTFERKDGTGNLPSAEVSGGTTTISLPLGTWEITASAYNAADSLAVVARAKNTLIRTGDQITGNTHFVLEPEGIGPGTLVYTITPPGDLTLDGAQSRIRIEQDGALIHSQAITGVLNSSFSLEPGHYAADIVLDDSASVNTAVYREAVVILLGLVTEIAFTPQARDFLDPDVRASITTPGTFGRTKNNSSHTVVGASEGGELNKTQALTVTNGTETVYFTLKKTAAQNIAIGGVGAGSVSMAAGGTVDGQVVSNTLAVFTVNTEDIAEDGGPKEFTLTLGEAGKTPITYTVTLTVAYLTYLHINAWPTKTVYLQGEEFDPTGLELLGIYSDGIKGSYGGYTLASSKDVTAGFTAEGFDSSIAGEQVLRITKNGVTGIQYRISNGTIWADYPSLPPVSDSFTITVQPTTARQLFFDYGVRISSVDTQPDHYLIPSDRTFVLTPVKWLIPDNATYEWKVDNVVQSSIIPEYLSLSPASQGTTRTVTVTAKLDGATIATATTTVKYTGPEASYKRPVVPGTSAARSERLLTWEGLAPGQHGQYGATSNQSLNGAGGFGAYTVFKFDHSVARNGTNGEELKIGGNAFSGWNEPGIIWVSQDLNGNGLPDDTWYELAGSHTFDSKTIRRYAVTYRRVGTGFYTTWVDNRGEGGSPGQLQRYWDYLPDTLTLVGTRLDNSIINLGSGAVWGYGDVFDNGRVSLSNAIQSDGTHVDLAYIDFVRIQTGIHYYHEAFGNGSTEAGTPTDRTLHDPNMVITGKAVGDGQYSYTFTNNSGYALTLTINENSFTLTVGSTLTQTYSSSTVYIDFYGGNADFTQNDGTVIFIPGDDASE